MLRSAFASNGCRHREDREEIEADFRQVLNNKAPDPALEDGDLIIIKESFF